MESLIETISKSLGYSSNYIYSKITCSNNSYLIYSIPKKKDGYRVIYSPSVELKVLQYFVHERYLSHLPVSKHSTAYIKGKSIITNCKEHLGNKHFLKIDIKDFFNSIPYEGVKELLKRYLKEQLSNDDIELLLNLISRNKRFVQGAVTSPTIANVYCYYLDKEIDDIVETIPNGKFTRYSDDIVISSSDFLEYSLIDKVSKILNKYGLTINKDKTVITSNPNSIRITGLNIVDFNRIKIGTDRKKKINNDIYYKLKYNDDRCKRSEEIIGNLMFIKMVEPYYFNLLNMKYRRNNKNLLSILKELDESNNLHYINPFRGSSGF